MNPRFGEILAATPCASTPADLGARDLDISRRSCYNVARFLHCSTSSHNKVRKGVVARLTSIEIYEQSWILKSDS